MLYEGQLMTIEHNFEGRTVSAIDHQDQSLDHRRRARRPKRPSVKAMIKAAKAAGLQIASIECSEDGVRLICGTQAASADTDESQLDRQMTEQMGVARLGGRKRR
jgi:hypothetical protein